MKKLFLGVLLFIGMLVIPFSVVKFEAVTDSFTYFIYMRDVDGKYRPYIDNGDYSADLIDVLDFAGGIGLDLIIINNVGIDIENQSYSRDEYYYFVDHQNQIVKSMNKDNSVRFSFSKSTWINTIVNHPMIYKDYEEYILAVEPPPSYAEGYDQARTDYGYNAGNGLLNITELVDSDKSDGYVTSEVFNSVDTLGFNDSSVYGVGKVEAYINNRIYLYNRAMSDDIVVFNEKNSSMGELHFTAPFGYYFTGVSFRLRASNLPPLPSGNRSADSMSLYVDGVANRYVVADNFISLDFANGRHIISFINDSTNNSPLVIGNLRFTLVRGIPQGVIKASDIKNYSQSFYTAYGAWITESDSYKEGKRIAFFESYQKGYEIFTELGLSDELSFNYLKGYDEGYNEGYDLAIEFGNEELANEWYNRGLADGGKKSFEANLHKWIVPAIILVLVVGGAMYFIKGRREY